MRPRSDINIVIVDDSSLLRITTHKLLLNQGFNVVFDAINGVDLLDKLLNAAILPDVCLLDVNMPLMDGFETARELKHKWPSIKILAYTINHDQETFIRMLQNGADGYVVKGCTTADMITAISQVYEHGYYFNDWACLNMLSFIRQPGIC